MINLLVAVQRLQETVVVWLRRAVKVDWWKFRHDDSLCSRIPSVPSSLLASAPMPRSVPARRCSVELLPKARTVQSRFVASITFTLTTEHCAQ